jgi:hypothetical protein
VGDAVGVGDTITSYRQGDMLGTGINALATGVGVLPLVGGPASKAVKAGGNKVRSALRGIDAWHGSPHEFENFSTDNIGTGAGLQAYGDGLYFAGNPERAIGYSYLLPDAKVDQSLMPAVFNFFENDYSLSKARAGMKSAYPNATNTEIDSALNEYYMHLDDQGYMYNVNLNVNPEDLLDSDIPLTDQSEKIRQMAANHLNLPKASSPSKQAYIDEKMGMTGNEFYRRVESDLGNADAASKAFSDADIKGIKYKAGKGEGANNFVMFDDSLIDTKRVNDKLTDSWMNPEARMARADEGGFDLDRTLYHYTDKLEDGEEFTSLSITPENVQTKLGRGIYTSPDNQYGDRYIRQGQDMSKAYGENARAIPVYARGKIATESDYETAYRSATENLNIKAQRGVVDANTKLNIRNNVQDEAQRILKDQGFTGAKFMDEVMIFDPKDVRSINAEFDPTKADSSDLLSSISPTQSSLRNIA